jgi:hypothetical protein
VTNEAAIQANPMRNIAAAALQIDKQIAARRSLRFQRGMRKIRCSARRQSACAAVIERHEFD